MAKSFTVTFNILGNLDKSLLAALQGATDKIKDLSKLQRAINSNALQSAKKLQNAQNALKQVEDFKALQKAIQNANKERAQELLTASRAQSARTAETQKLQQMQAAYKNLQKVQRQLLSERDSQKLGIAQTKRDLDAAKIAAKNSKNAGDLVGFKNASAQVQSLTNSLKLQRDAAKATAAEMKNINSALKQGRQELSNQKNIVGNADKELIQSSKRAADLQLQLHNQQQQLSQLRLKIPTGNVSAAESALRSQIQATTDALNREIAAIERRNQLLNNFNQSQQNLSNAYSNFQNAIQTAQTIMNPFAEAAQNAMTYEKAMSKVKSLTQMRNLRAGNLKAVEEEMAALSAQAKELGATTEFTATEVANAMGFYGMAGWDTKRIQAIMQSTLDLASIAGDHNIARTADVLSDDLSALGMKAGRQMRLSSGKIVEESSYFADAFAYAITQANLSRESLHEALKYNAPTAHASGLSLGETLAMNMISANAGIKGSQAGTSFRQGWVRFLAPPKTAVKALQEMGKEMGVVISQSDALKASMESAATLKSIGVDENSDLFTKITKAYEHYQSLEKSQRAGWLKGLVGQTALSAWQNVFDAGNIEQIARIAQEIDSGAIEGWAKDTAAVMRDNTITEVEYLKSALDALQISVGDAFLPSIRQAAQALTPLVSGLNDWIMKNQTAVQWAGILAAAISGIVVAGAGLALLASFGQFVASGLMLAFNAVRSFITILSAARAAVVGFGIISAAATAIAAAPVWAIIAAVGLLIGIIGYATGAFDGLGDALANAWNHPQGAIEGFTQLVRSKMDSLVNYVMDRWNTMKSALAHPLDAVINFLDHGDVIGGNVVSGEMQRQQAAVNQSQQHYQSVGGGIGAIQNQVVELDTAQAQNQIDSLGQAALLAGQSFSGYQTAAINTANNLTNVDNAALNTANNLSNVDNAVLNTANNLTNVDNAALNTANNLTNVDNAALNTANNLTNVDNAAINTANNLTNVDNAAINTANNLSNVDNAAINTANNLSNLDSAVMTSSIEMQTAGQNAVVAGNDFQAAGVAAQSAISSFDALSGAVSAVASALSAKAGEISAIVINVPKVNYVPMNIGIPGGTQHLASGGIFNKGTFLTTFAESSPEAAIPINNSARSLSLWERTGQLLGVSPSQSFYSDSSPISINISVNVNGNADKNIVRAGIEESLPRVKSFAEELAAYNHERARRSFR